MCQGIDQPHHQFLLRGQAFGHQQRRRHQRVVVDELLHRPRQQMRRPAGHVGVEQFVAKTLLDGGNGRGQPIAAQLAEQLRGLALGDRSIL